MKTSESKEEIDVEKTIEAIINNNMVHTGVNVRKLMEKARENPLFLIEIAKELRVEVVYKKIE